MRNCFSELYFPFRLPKKSNTKKVCTETSSELQVLSSFNNSFWDLKAKENFTRLMKDINMPLKLNNWNLIHIQFWCTKRKSHLRAWVPKKMNCLEPNSAEGHFNIFGFGHKTSCFYARFNNMSITKRFMSDTKRCLVNFQTATSSYTLT